MKSTIIIGSRGSELALWQARYAQSLLRTAGFEVGIKVIQTKGDAIQHLSFDKIEGKGFFTKELEMALLQGEIDLAVHSYKDLPTQSEEGLIIGACSYRDNPLDILVIHSDAYDQSMPLSLRQNAVVGTSAARRKAQLRAIRPDLQLMDLRGNVPTRLGKVGKGYDAVILAAAGLNRLQLDLRHYKTLTLSPTQSVPAPAQGILAYQIREDDVQMKQIVSHLNQPDVAKLVHLERDILHQLGGGCQQPIGVYATQNEDLEYLLWASFAKDEHDFPKRVFIKSPNLSGLAEAVITRLKFAQSKTVFISRQLSSDSYFARALKHRNFAVHAHSLVAFASIPFDQIPATDWVFFSSQHGVRFFFEQNPVLNDAVQFAAIGGATAQAIRQYKKECSFEGEGADTVQIATRFGELAHGKRVLFPMGDNGLQTVQKILGHAIESENLLVYKNQEKEEFELPQCQILVFTSPLNVRAYCRHYHLKEAEKIIAIGNTTGEELAKQGCHNYILPYHPDEVSLSDMCW